MTKNRIVIPQLLLIFLVVFFLCSCKKNIPDTVSDIDGNVYNTVTIGKQVWMAENLKVTKYRNGEPIPNITSRVQWSNLASGAYCNYQNNDTNACTYGRLYNWFAVADSRNVAPQGWHIPSDKEFEILIDFLGGEAVAGNKLKNTGDFNWIIPANGTIKSSGFLALPAGYRNGYYGTFQLVRYNSFWWTANTARDTLTWARMLSTSDTAAFRNYLDKTSGLSIRCLMD